MESFTESTSAVATEQDVDRVAQDLFVAAHNDPVAFSVLHDVSSKDALRHDVAGAISAVRAKGRDARLTKAERSALEAIILLVGRPALLIREDKFDVPRGEWEMLAPYRPDIVPIIRSVGRIAASPAFGHPYEGTGFVVGADLIMTNAHVVQDYVEKSNGGWTFIPGSGMKIDFKQEFGSAEKLQFSITAVVAIHPREDIDLALLRVASTSTNGKPLPAPLAVQCDAGYVTEQGMVYVVGYPAADPQRNDVNEMHRIFEGKYEKKRLSPGRITSLSDMDKILIHDCSTLGGNSGSCVVDLSTHTVVGLHFEGTYLEENRAVLLTELCKDPVLAGVNFKKRADGHVG